MPLTGPVISESHHRAMTTGGSSGSLADAGYRAGSVPGPTDFRTRSGGECEVGALGIGTYWFARDINELTVRSRLASPGSTMQRRSRLGSPTSLLALHAPSPWYCQPDKDWK